MGVLAYKFPNEPEVIRVGIWSDSNLDKLPEPSFFVTDFLKQHVYAFDLAQSKTVDTISDVQEFHRTDTIPHFIAKQEYLERLNGFQHEMKQQEIQKAIFSRVKQVKTQLSIAEIFNTLCEKYAANALVYCISDASFGTWIGATPEILISGTEQELRTTALAGTKNEKHIEWRQKEKEEQGYVSDYIHEKLLQFVPNNRIQTEAPHTFFTGAVYHLKNDFKFPLKSDKWSELIQVLHPTPAVCGVPTEKAAKLISQQEPHNRKLYTGIIGLKNKDYIQSYVNLRCMEYAKNECWLYLGGGITNDSSPMEEWNETENKALTLVKVIGEN